MTREEIIAGLKFTVEMFLFDPSTGETYTEPRNDMDKTTIDACKGAIELLEKMKWTPISEPPKEDGEYLIYGKIFPEEEECYRFFGDYYTEAGAFGFWQEQHDSTTLGSLGSEFEEYAEVIAWMPLPLLPHMKESEVQNNE